MENWVSPESKKDKPNRGQGTKFLVRGAGAEAPAKRVPQKQNAVLRTTPTGVSRGEAANKPKKENRGVVNKT